MILRRLPDSRFSEVVREWQGETCVILGGGPSLTLEQVEQVHVEHAFGHARCIAVNACYLLAGWSDLSYFADAQFWAWHTQGTPMIGLTAAQVRERFAAFKGEKCSIQSQAESIKDERVHILRNRDGTLHGFGLSADPRALVTGRNSGVQALQVAILAGAKTVILLGFDGRPTTAGKTHWHGSHPLPTPDDAYWHYRNSFTHAAQAIKAAGVRVINCSPDSAIDAFETMDLDDALCLERDAA